MSNNRARLRELGYSTDAEGHIVCHRQVGGGRGYEDRYLHERCGVIRIDIERDTRSTRELIERLIAAADEPRALVGRSRNGSAVLLFRVTDDLPHTADDGISKLLTRDGERVTIVCASLGQSVDVGAWVWQKSRSPLDVQRDSLAVLFADIGQRVIDEAFKSASWAPTDAELEREREAAERIAKLKIEIEQGLHTPDARQAREDDELVARFPDVSQSDGLWTQRIFEALGRVRARRETAAQRETA